jgi:hypothetical protein
VLLLGNVAFYAFVVGAEWLRFASILWLYGTLFWLSVHVYLTPLLLHRPAARLGDLYRRAALIALGHPLASLLLVLALLLLGLASALVLPVYLLVAGAYVALVQAHAFRAVRRLHGDVPADEEEAEPA